MQVLEKLTYAVLVHFHALHTRMTPGYIMPPPFTYHSVSEPREATSNIVVVSLIILLIAESKHDVNVTSSDEQNHDITIAVHI